MIKIKCPNCGADIQLQEGNAVSFCPECGKKLISKKKKESNSKAEILKSRLSLEKEKMETEKDIELERIQSAENVKQKELDLKRERLRHVESEKKRRFIVTLIIAFVAVIGGVIIIPRVGHSFNKMVESENNKIRVPASAKKYRGENYKEVVKELTDAGFENIEAEPVKSKVKGRLRKNKIKSISIAGIDDFDEDTRFDKTDQIRIFYHTNK